MNAPNSGNKIAIMTRVAMALDFYLPNQPSNVTVSHTNSSQGPDGCSTRPDGKRPATQDSAQMQTPIFPGSGACPATRPSG